MTRLAEMFNVNHFIVSQVNPHVVPFLIKDEAAIGEEVKNYSSIISPGSSWFNSLSHLAKGEALHRMHTLADMGIFPNILTKTVSVLSQKYSGDITIFPEISYSDFPRMLSNPTPEFMRHAMLSGERATWPKISIIKNHCAIELALDDAVQKLRARVAFSPSEVELRMSKQITPTSNTGRGIKGGRRTRVKRPLSQNSTASAPFPAIGNTTLYTHNQSGSGRPVPGLRHKKSRSLNTVIAEPSSSLLPPKASTSTGEPLAPTQTLNDVTSSGADEMNSTLTTSSSSTSFSSPTDEPSSPVTDSEPKWHHGLFSSVSQPNTPIPHHSAYFNNSQTPMSAKATTADPSFVMTPSKSTTDMASSPPESRYKRLFHHRPQGQAAATLLGKNREPSSSRERAKEKSRPARDATSPKLMKRNWALEIDIPAATKSLVSRGKKKS